MTLKSIVYIEKPRARRKAFARGGSNRGTGGACSARFDRRTLVGMREGQAPPLPRTRRRCHFDDANEVSVTGVTTRTCVRSPAVRRESPTCRGDQPFASQNDRPFEQRLAALWICGCGRALLAPTISPVTTINTLIGCAFQSKRRAQVSS